MTAHPTPVTAAAEPSDILAASGHAPRGSVFASEQVRYAFYQRGLRVNEVANRLDIAATTLETVLRGSTDPGELRVATVAALAELLGLPLHSMFKRPPDDEGRQPASPGATDRAGVCPDAPTAGHEPRSAAIQLIACLYANGRSNPTRVTEIAASFGWTFEQTRQAAAEASTRLQSAGLRMYTGHGELFIAPVEDHLDAERALDDRKTYERGLSVAHYKAAHQILSGQRVTNLTTGRRRHRLIGGLVNLGVVTSTAQPALSPEASEAFL